MKKILLFSAIVAVLFSSCGTSPRGELVGVQELTEFCENDRPIHIAKELTKFHEEHIHSNIGRRTSRREHLELSFSFPCEQLSSGEQSFRRT